MSLNDKHPLIISIMSEFVCLSMYHIIVQMNVIILYIYVIVYKSMELHDLIVIESV